MDLLWRYRMESYSRKTTEIEKIANELNLTLGTLGVSSGREFIMEVIDGSRKMTYIIHSRFRTVAAARKILKRHAASH